MSRNLQCPCGETLAVETPGELLRCSRCGRSFDPVDVFISYSSADQTAADRAGAALQKNRIRCWTAPRKMLAGQRWPQEIANAIARARILVLVLSRRSIRSIQVRRELELAKDWDLKLVPLRLDDAELPPEMSSLGDIHFIDATKPPLEPHLEKRVESVNRHSTELREQDWDRRAAGEERRGVDPENPPYIGPQPYPAECWDLLFGRDREAEEIADIITRHSPMLLYSQSGAGKSSLANTLVRRRLEAAGFEVLPIVRVGAALPVDEEPLAEDCNPYTLATICSLGSASQAGWSDYQSLTIHRYLASRPVAEGQRGRVLVLDQFEEIFTHELGTLEHQHGFFRQLGNAVQRAEGGLRLVLVFRQEYLAEVEHRWAEELHPEGQDKYFLQRLGHQGALEAVIGPARRQGMVDFEPEVVEGLVKELSKVKEGGPDGTVRIHEGEYVEPVHLQISCRQLWQNLEPGLTVVTAADVEAAARRKTRDRRGREKNHQARRAGLSSDLHDFVGEVLEDFYHKAVHQAAAERIDQQRLRPSVSDSLQLGEHERREPSRQDLELIHLGCMQFVTAKGTRTMVRREDERTGRLPNDVVDSLVSYHLLHSEKHGGETWYELAHDTLTQPIERQRKRNVELIQLLNALDTLTAWVKKTRGDNESEPFSGFFEAYDGVVKAVEAFTARPGLYRDEAEFIFRSSLCSGYRLEEWALRLQQDYPAVFEGVVAEALAFTPSGTVRRNAARLLGERQLARKSTGESPLASPAPHSPSDRPPAEPAADDLTDELYRLALEDDDRQVSTAAAVSLAKLDHEALHDTLVAKLGDKGQSRWRVLNVLARIKNLTLRQPGRGRFEEQWPQIPWLTRKRVLLRVGGLRLRAGALRLIAAPAMAIAFAAPVTALARGSMAHFGLTQTQASNGFVRGAFHGISGAVFFASCIALALAFHWVVFERGEPDPVTKRRLRPAMSGSLGGLIGGTVTMLFVVGVFEVAVHEKGGWLEPQASDIERTSGMSEGALREHYYGNKILDDLLLETRMGLLHPLIGLFCGIGAAFSICAVSFGRRWQKLMQDETERGPVNRARRVLSTLKAVTILGFLSSWRVFVPLMLAAILHSLIARPGSMTIPEYADKMLLKNLGDSFSIYVGSIGIICGILYSTMVLRIGVGVSIKPQKEWE